MKRLLSVFLAAVCLLSLLTACGSKPSVPENLDLETVYQNILDAQTAADKENLVLFPESNPDLIESLYSGLSAIECKQQVIYMPPVTGAASEIVLIEVANAADAQTVADIFQARIDDGASNTAYPELAVLWKNNAQVQIAGNYVAMIILPTGYTIPENVFIAK